MRCGAWDDPAIVRPRMAKALIVVPTYNERDNVPGIAERFSPPCPGAELLFVDDNSPDGTGAAARRHRGARAARPRHAPRRQARASAPRTSRASTGRSTRGYEYLFEMDADGSHDPKYLPADARARRGRRRRRGRLAQRARRRHGQLGDRPQADLARRQLLRAHDPRHRRPRRHRRLHLLAAPRARGARPRFTRLERLHVPDRDEVPRTSSTA